jgi:hypothetical protein
LAYERFVSDDDTVFGAPTEELRKVLDRFGATYVRLFD